MIIYGVSLLAFCMLAGIWFGKLLGLALGIDANIGGVGIAMVMLILLSNLLHTKFRITTVTESGIQFWSAMYIPIVIAMAAKQNVMAALSGGWIAVISGIAAVALSFSLIPLFTRLGESQTALDAEDDK